MPTIKKIIKLENIRTMNYIRPKCTVDKTDYPEQEKTVAWSEDELAQKGEAVAYDLVAFENDRALVKTWV